LRRTVAAAAAQRWETQMSFDGQVAMITGAAGTLGRATAQAFAAAGAKLVLLDLDTSKLADNADCMAVSANLGDAAAVASAVAAAHGRFGRIDVLCNLAGGFRMGNPVHETPDEVWRLMIELNAGSILRTARAVVPHMLKAGSGKIVNVAAMGGTVGGALMGAYAASKSAVIRLTESMAAELRDKGINVNCVLPSTLDTPPNRASMPGADPKKWVAPEALADVILFLASAQARAINGAALPVVGLV
jgi:NAD(P)-dependent dehydrogenase (short-subunit alcohol dehydrogenase family)